MAVSKDGSLSFISFSVEEIGVPLSEDETVGVTFSKMFVFSKMYYG